MSDIKVTIAKDVIRESVFINQNASAGDQIIKDENGKVVDVIKDANILAKGSSRKEAANQIYGKIR